MQREFEQRRVDEANELLDAGREGEVEFTGTIEAIQPNAWIVSSLVVQLDANTQIVGTPQIDRVAEVRGVTGPQRPAGLLHLDRIIRRTGDYPDAGSDRKRRKPQRRRNRQNLTRQPTTVTPQPRRRGSRAAPRPTATVQPTATPEPVEVEFTGSVNAIDAGTWNIDGTTVIVNDNTEIRGAINAGTARESEGSALCRWPPGRHAHRIVRGRRRERLQQQ